MHVVLDENARDEPGEDAGGVGVGGVGVGVRVVVLKGVD